MSNLTKAIAYCRVATTKQAEQNNSVEAQKQRITEYAARHDFEIVKWFERIGSSQSNTALLEALEYCKNHKSIRYVIVTEPSRISRSATDFFFWEKDFISQYVYFVFTKNPGHQLEVPVRQGFKSHNNKTVEGSKTDTSLSRFIERTRAVLEDFETEFHAECVRESLRRKKEQGKVT